MKKLVVLAALMLSIPVFLSCATAGLKGTLESDTTATITATVVAVDLQNRVLTLKGPAGNVVDVAISDDVKNLPQVAVGDELKVSFTEAVAISLYKKGSVPVENSVAETVTKADPGQKPSATVNRAVTFTAVIQSIDLTVPNVTLKGANGNTITIGVRDPKILENMKVGDEVVTTYNLAVAIGITKPAGK